MCLSLCLSMMIKYRCRTDLIACEMVLNEIDVKVIMAAVYYDISHNGGLILDDSLFYDG